MLIQRYVNSMRRRILRRIRKMEVTLVTDDLLNLAYCTQSVISCFQILCDCFIFFRIFNFGPCELHFS